MAWRKSLTIFTAILSAALTVVTIAIIYPQTLHTTPIATNGGRIFGGLAQMLVVRYPYAQVFLSLSTVGWLLTAYQVFAQRRKDVARLLRKDISGRRDNWEIYNTFKGRGGVRRLTIMESLSIPRQRSEVASITNTDWKEVDRNIRILESANLVRARVSKAPYPSYELTDQGQELLKKISSAVES